MLVAECPIVITDFFHYHSESELNEYKKHLREAIDTDYDELKAVNPELFTSPSVTITIEYFSNNTAKIKREKEIVILSEGKTAEQVKTIAKEESRKLAIALAHGDEAFIAPYISYYSDRTVIYSSPKYIYNKTICPICYSEIISKEGEGIQIWSDDPLLTAEGLAGEEYIGFNSLNLNNIKQIQDKRIEQEEEVEISESNKTAFSSLNSNGLFNIKKQHIYELRESTEKILDAIGWTKLDYFNYDAQGNKQLTNQTEWYDVNLDNPQIRAIHIEDLRHHLSTIMTYYGVPYYFRNKYKIWPSTSTYGYFGGWRGDITIFDSKNNFIFRKNIFSIMAPDSYFIQLLNYPVWANHGEIGSVYIFRIPTMNWIEDGNYVWGIISIWLQTVPGPEMPRASSFVEYVIKLNKQDLSLVASSHKTYNNFPVPGLWFKYNYIASNTNYLYTLARWGTLSSSNWGIISYKKSDMLKYTNINLFPQSAGPFSGESLKILTTDDNYIYAASSKVYGNYPVHIEYKIYKIAINNSGHLTLVNVKIFKSYSFNSYMIAVDLGYPHYGLYSIGIKGSELLIFYGVPDKVGFWDVEIVRREGIILNTSNLSKKKIISF